MQRRKQRIHSHCVRSNRYEEDQLHTLAWSSDDIVEHRQRLLHYYGRWFQGEDTHLIFLPSVTMDFSIGSSPYENDESYTILFSTFFDAASVQLFTSVGSHFYVIPLLNCLFTTIKIR